MPRPWSLTAGWVETFSHTCHDSEITSMTTYMRWVGCCKRQLWEGLLWEKKCRVGKGNYPEIQIQCSLSQYFCMSELLTLGSWNPKILYYACRQY